MEILEGRRTIREFEDQPIPKEDIEKIVHACRISPTARHLQPADILVVTNKEKIDEACNVSVSSWPEEDQKRWAARKELYGVKNVLSCDAPCMIFIHLNERATGNFPMIDVGILSMSIMVAARDLGYETMCVGAIVWGNKEGVEKVLGIPEGKLVMSLAIGKARKEQHLNQREDHMQVRYIE